LPRVLVTAIVQRNLMIADDLDAALDMSEKGGN
jgi:hypothetical protein